MKPISLLLLLFQSAVAYSQQPSPISLIYNPRVNTFAISGVGGGNLYEFTDARGSASGQIAVDYNISLKDDKTRKGKDRNLTLMPLVKWNPTLQAKYQSGDTLSIRKLAFIDNEYSFFVGFRLNQIREFGNTDNSKWLNSVFIDMSYTPYKLTGSSNPNNSGFSNLNFNLGGQFGFITNTEIGLFGVTFNPQLNYISVYEEKSNGSSLEELIHVNNTISRNYLGAGLKMNIAINDFSIFFETRKYFPLNTSYSVPGLNDRMIFSIGGVATGTAFKTKTKETSDR